MEDGDSAYGGGGTDVTRDGDAVTPSIAAGVYRDGVSAWPSPWAGRAGRSGGPSRALAARLVRPWTTLAGPTKRIGRDLAFGLACITIL
jgi:hypothetical protein